MGNSGTALGIIGIILAAGGTGLSFFVWNGQTTLKSDLNDMENNFNNLTRTIVVGIWDELDRNMDYSPHNLQNNWLTEFGDNKLFSTEHLSLSRSYTRISLLKVGWYRIHLSMMVTDLDANNNYRIYLNKDGVFETSFDYFEVSARDSIEYYCIHSSVFVESDGTNYIEINGYSSTDSFITSYQIYNLLTIEYVSV